jgi:hypothetical protein
VSEELARLRSHVEQFQKLLAGAGEAGKKLDFLLQEMQREANTLLSKTPGVEAEGWRSPAGARSKIRYREAAGAGAERRMTLDRHSIRWCSSFPARQGRANPRWCKKCWRCRARCFPYRAPRGRPAPRKAPENGMILYPKRNSTAGCSEGEFLEHARVFGRHQYGTPRRWLDEAQCKGLDLVLEIDVQGAEQVKQKLPPRWPFSFLPPAKGRT